MSRMKRISVSAAAADGLAERLPEFFLLLTWIINLKGVEAKSGIQA